jgi:hypothetical protein
MNGSNPDLNLLRRHDQSQPRDRERLHRLADMTDQILRARNREYSSLPANRIRTLAVAGEVIEQ